MPPVELPKLTRSQQSRLNGSKSKGPITAAGKARSSQNSLKHGFAAQANTLIAPDNSEAWHAHIAGFHDSYHPSNYQESQFVDQLASISWRQARLVGIETALIDFQLSVQQETVEEYFEEEAGNPYFHLALAWQGLATKAYPRTLPAPDPTDPPERLDIGSIELVRRYQVSLDRQFRNAMVNLRQYRKDFAPQESTATATQPPQHPPTPNEPTAPIGLSAVGDAKTPLGTPISRLATPHEAQTLNSTPIHPGKVYRVG